MKSIFILLVKAYQVTISPYLGSNCRFYPSCSHYMIEAIEKKGVIKGVYLGVKRLSKCHPWGESGLDPVPPCKCDNEKQNKES
ncbi:membrane protein insertion efficiency factor YidD [Marinomonas sp. 5E14-1]|uniref:membrane protein insertion efficiency factor YidD n=1 Tax=Marinomonas sp. 5E14-1 TaxID=3153922 RepID=UPI003266781F